MRNIIEVKRLNPGAVFPTRATVGATGFDLHAADNGWVRVGCAVHIPTGIALAMPPEYEAQIRSRSGLARDFGVCVLNGIGTIDSDYRGEVGVLLINHGRYTFNWKAGDRIAQIVFQRKPAVLLVEAPELSPTARGDGGFGSSGR